MDCAGAGQSRKPGATSSPVASSLPSSSCQSRYGPHASPSWHVGAAQHALAPVGDGPQLDRRAVGAGGRRGADGHESPQLRSTPADRDLGGARHPPNGGLARVRHPAGVVPGQRAGGRAVLETQELPAPEPHAEDLVPVGTSCGPKPHRDRSLDPPVRELIRDEGGHRTVRHQLAFPDRWTELGVIADDTHRGLLLLRRGQRLARARFGDGVAGAVERRVHEHRPLRGVVVEGRPDVGRLLLLATLRVREHGGYRDHATVAVAQLVGDGRSLQGRVHGFACALRARPPRDHLNVQLSASFHPILLERTDR
jgi:hypothetical protein